MSTVVAQYVDHRICNTGLMVILGRGGIFPLQVNSAIEYNGHLSFFRFCFRNDVVLAAGYL